MTVDLFHLSQNSCLLPHSHLTRLESMSSQQFELLRNQLQLLSPQQLKSLQGEITNTLGDQNTNLLTDEEKSLIFHLFS